MQRHTGQVLVLAAIGIVALLAIIGLAIDGGNLYTQRRLVQNAADASALAGARLMVSDKSASDDAVRAEVVNYVDINKIPDATNHVTAYYTDQSATRVGVALPNNSTRPANAVGCEVLVDKSVSTYFIRIIGITSLSVRARAVAIGTSSSTGIGILVLNPNAQGALTISGSAGINVNGQVIVNSDSAQAATSSGSASLTSKELDVTGNYTSSASSYFAADTIKTGVAPTPDFLAGLPTPDPSTMTVRSTSTYNAKSGETLQPGVYIGGINMSSQKGITLSPGIYYMQGGGFSMSGGSTMTALNVMIYNGANSSGATGAINISGGSGITMTPPSGGPYKNISLFQDRNSTQKVTLSGGSNWDFSGTVYARSAHVDLSGGSGGKVGSQYVSDTLTLSGSSAFQSIDPGTAQSSSDIYLIE